MSYQCSLNMKTKVARNVPRNYLTDLSHLTQVTLVTHMTFSPKTTELSV